MKKEVVILAKSTKRGGYCVGGIDVNNGKWVRLTSSEQWSHGALTDKHMTCEDGSVCNVLDCVRVDVERETPILHQPENVLIDEKKIFKKLGTWSLQDVLRIHPAEPLTTVYGNTAPFLEEEDMKKVDRSLILIQTPWLRIFQRSTDPEKPRTKANFCYKGDWYNAVSVTDPEFYQVADQTTLEPAYLVVSLPDVPFENGRYYKFIAKIFA